MQDRLTKILQHEKLTSAKFADLIGVQRSSVSHILSGRNKPSLDFLGKILAQFPHLSGDWLISGNGAMIKTGVSSKTITNSNNLFNQSNTVIKQEDVSQTPLKPGNTISKLFNDSLGIQSQQSVNNTDNSPGNNTIIKKTENKHIDRIVVFYSDRTFIEYLSAD
ncbi:MAG: helix-turn-helix transcriptional regulator [Marinilabiliaceae bacterium]|nr:helix-turn-helix transcriptional regulator [Marinilabiliaceae bacterium]